VTKLSPAPAAGPGTLLVEKDAQTVNETDGTAVVNVLRLCGSAGAVTVDFSTTAGTAVPGDNYQDVSGTVTFDDGDATPKSIPIPLLDNHQIQCDPQTFDLNLSNPGGGASLGLPTTTVSIEDGDQGQHLFQKTFQVRDANRATGPAWNATVDQPWLFLSADSGFGPSTVTVTVEIAGLSPGTYTGTITITSDGAVGSPQTIQVTVDIQPGAGGGGGV